MVRSLTLQGAGEGVSFFLKPDFTKLNAESALVALGHAFFSPSLGMGCMLTYGSYVEKKQSLGSATLAIGFGDLLYAFIAGLIIFPTVFSYGLQPGEGVGLAFMALPTAFSQMKFGYFFGGVILPAAFDSRTDFGDFDSRSARIVCDAEMEVESEKSFHLHIAPLFFSGRTVGPFGRRDPEPVPNWRQNDL